MGVPEDRIGMKISRWVKPEIELLFSISLALAKDIGVEYVRIATQIPQELEIYLIPSRPFRGQLKPQISKSVYVKNNKKGLT